MRRKAAALRAAWGEYPGDTSDARRAWPGFVQVTNATLDAKLDAKLARARILSRKSKRKTQTSGRPHADGRLEVRAVRERRRAGEADAGRSIAASAPILARAASSLQLALHGPVVVGVPRVSRVRGKLHAEVLEGRERRGEPRRGSEGPEDTSMPARFP